MKFGVCCNIVEARLALAEGFDYVELGASAIAASPDLSVYRETPIEATNLFFPSDIKLFGPAAEDFHPYAVRAIHAADKLGVRVMVVGSGGARRAPDGMPVDVAESGFVEIAQSLQELASEFGIIIAPESLNRSETNVGNDLGKLAAALRTRGVGYTADLYHILYEANADGVEPDYVAQVPFAPNHVHLADLPRFAPSAEDPELIAFAARLRDLGYDERVSLECRVRPDENLAKTYATGLATMRSLFN